LEDKMTAKQSSPLQGRIVTVLGNPNASAAELSELVAETELAIVAADEVIANERAAAADLTSTPSADAAQDAISRAEAAALNRDRLQSVLPKIRNKLAGALRSEEHDRWLSDFSGVRQQRDDAASLFRDYPQHANMICQMFAMAAEVDKEVSRINGTAPDGENRRLRKVELEARELDGFTLDNPSLATTVELRDWKNAGQKLWPNTLSLAAQYAATAVSYPYHPGAAWSDPNVQAQRRAEQAKQNREIGEHYQRMTAEQEDRINREERERMTASRRAT
jgi:hypothetical protein